jgi:hypothetical protein
MPHILCNDALRRELRASSIASPLEPARLRAAVEGLLHFSETE